MVSFTKCT